MLVVRSVLFKRVQYLCKRWISFFCCFGITISVYRCVMNDSWWFLWKMTRIPLYPMKQSYCISESHVERFFGLYSLRVKIWKFMWRIITLILAKQWLLYLSDDDWLPCPTIACKFCTKYHFPNRLHYCHGGISWHHGKNPPPYAAKTNLAELHRNRLSWSTRFSCRMLVTLDVSHIYSVVSSSRSKPAVLPLFMNSLVVTKSFGRILVDRATKV